MRRSSFSDEPFAGVRRGHERRPAEAHATLAWRGPHGGWFALHDLEQVLATFPETLLLARRAIAWGETATALTPEKFVEAGLAAPAAGARSAIAAWQCRLEGDWST